MNSVNADGLANPGFCRHSGTRCAQHPETGRQIEGFQVPPFRDVIELPLNSSRVFGFMGKIGGDIDVTEDGPSIIEGNLL